MDHLRSGVSCQPCDSLADLRICQCGGDLLGLGGAHAVDMAHGDAPGDDPEDVLADLMVVLESVHEGIVDHGDAALAFKEALLVFGREGFPSPDGGVEKVEEPPPSLGKLLAVNQLAIEYRVLHGANK